MKTDLLKGKIRECGKTQKDVANAIGTSLSGFNAKLNGARGAEFSLSEVRAIKQLFDLTSEQVDLIFFS